MSDKQKTNDSGKLSFWESYSISIGFVIGVGIITMTGVAIGYTGVGVMLAFIFAGIACLIMDFPKILAVSVTPKTSISYLIATSLDARFAGMAVYIMFLQSFSAGLLGVTFLNYLGDIINLPDDRTVLTIVVLTIFFGINALGAKNVALTQTIMNVLLIGGWGSFLFFGLSAADASMVTVENLFPNGASGMISSVAMLTFAMGGGAWATEGGGRIQNPTKNIMKINFAATGTAMILFSTIGFIASTVLPIEEVANQSLTLVAKEVYPGNLYLAFVVGGALIAVVTTLNASIMNYVNGIYRSTKDGWFPPIFAKENKFGVPTTLLFTIFAVNLVPILLKLNTATFSRLTSGMNLLAKAIPIICCYFYLKKNKEAWENSPYHVSDGVLISGLCVSGALCAFFIFDSFKSYSVGLAAGVIITLVAMFIFASTRKKIYENTIANRTAEEEEAIK